LLTDPPFLPRPDAGFAYFLPAQTLPLLLMAFGSAVPAVTEVDAQIEPTDDRHGTLIVVCLLAPYGIVVHEHVTL
jgi:hypothetical protein